MSCLTDSMVLDTPLAKRSLIQAEGCLSYAEAHDRLTGSSLYREFMDSFDENHDGIIDYDENERKGFWSPAMRVLTYSQGLALSGKYGALKTLFYGVANLSLSPVGKNWNPGGHDFAREHMLRLDSGPGL
ncbi:MAG: hypothetical protein AB9866_26340 [Syntrophobacteraceae bacterium]